MPGVCFSHSSFVHLSFTTNSTDCIEIIFDHLVDRAGVGSQPQCECFKSCSFFSGVFNCCEKF